MDQVKVLIDASVLIAAIINPRGGLAVIIELVKGQIIKGFLTKSIVQETVRNLNNKRPTEELGQGLKLILDLKSCITENPTSEQVEKASKIIDLKDAHVVAAAFASKVDFLVTLDKKHFFTDYLNQANLPFKIIVPGDLLSIVRKKLL